MERRLRVLRHVGTTGALVTWYKAVMVHVGGVRLFMLNLSTLVMFLGELLSVSTFETSASCLEIHVLTQIR